MTASASDVEEVLASAPLRRLSLEKYHQMIEAGILDEDDRVELLNGVIVEMSPQDERHMQAITRLNKSLIRSLDDSFEVRPQGPLTLGPDSEPEPDLAVIRTADLRPRAHPSTALVVIEVAASTIRKDRRVKGSLYARANIPEYWIVNLEDETVEVYRDPDSETGRYRTLTTLRGSDALASALLPSFSFTVAALFD